jgi:uncharacterized protein YdhG (YjbR/CyaY superfamily)
LRNGQSGSEFVAKTDFKSVDDYIASLPEAVRPVLEEVRRAIRTALPEATEVISYQIPAYKIAAGAALYFAGWKDHYSLYPINRATLEAFAKELEPYDFNSKGTLHLPLSAPVPAKLIGRIAKFRAKAITAAKPAAVKKRKG